MAQALAIKYRPTDFTDVVEQESIKIILQQQLESNDWKHAYLFCGGAGTGKTTCARIFANELNEGEGNPIELDAASNNGVDDVREIIKQAKTKSLDSKYKVFILDECHMLSNSAWNAMLKLIEEPPATSIFIFATTDPQKIPKTIISRVQRYDFHRISNEGIIYRLNLICANENISAKDEALEYIAKLASGGMRDAITLLDKCISYNKEVTVENAVKALGTVDYDIMIQLSNSLCKDDYVNAFSCLGDIYNSGKDVKQFVTQYTQFLVDVNKYLIGCNWEYISLPQTNTIQDWLDGISKDNADRIYDILSSFVTLESRIKYSATPLYDLQAAILLLNEGE